MVNNIITIYYPIICVKLQGKSSAYQQNFYCENSNNKPVLAFITKVLLLCDC